MLFLLSSKYFFRDIAQNKANKISTPNRYAHVQSYMFIEECWRVISVDKSRVVINDRTSKRHRSCGIRGRRRVTSDIAFDVSRRDRFVRFELSSCPQRAPLRQRVTTPLGAATAIYLSARFYLPYTHTHQLIYARARTRDAGHTLAYSLPPPDDKHGCRALWWLSARVCAAECRTEWTRVIWMRDASPGDPGNDAEHSRVPFLFLCYCRYRREIREFYLTADGRYCLCVSHSLSFFLFTQLFGLYHTSIFLFFRPFSSSPLRPCEREGEWTCSALHVIYRWLHGPSRVICAIVRTAPWYLRVVSKWCTMHVSWDLPISWSRRFALPFPSLWLDSDTSWGNVRRESVAMRCIINTSIYLLLKGLVLRLHVVCIYANAVSTIQVQFIYSNSSRTFEKFKSI